MDEIMPEVRAFERELDAVLESLPSLECDGEACLSLASDIVESLYHKGDTGNAQSLEVGLYVLLPYFVKRRSSKLPTIEQLMPDLWFAGHYYLLRDYLYYTYNAPGSIAWTFAPERVAMRFKDRSIPRQYYLQENNTFMTSIETFDNFPHGKSIRDLLAGRDEVTPSDELIRAWDLIQQEADLKLGIYYNFIDPQDEVTLGDYTYKQFHCVYRVLLTKALYHRYYAAANLPFAGSVSISRRDLLHIISTETDTPLTASSAILADLVYDRPAADAGVSPLYMPLYAGGNGDQIVMMPHTFATRDGLTELLRVIGIRRPHVFSSGISGVLGDALVTRVKGMFTEQGFSCTTNIELSKFERGLPDIDLLVVSEEPTFGYVMFFCELKNPIPPRWAKDHLKALNGDSIAKAFEQTARIQKFLETERGEQFIRSQLPPGGLPYFGEEFLVSPTFLVITSFNVGMFFGDQQHTIIDYHTLGRILKTCDGDITYLSGILKSLMGSADQCLSLVPIECEVGQRQVTYEGVTVGKLMDFPQNTYKSIGLDKKMAAEFIADGCHPYDVLQEVPEHRWRWANLPTSIHPSKDQRT